MFDYNEFRNALRSLVASIYGPITSGEWTGWAAEDQELLNTAVHAVNKVYNKKLRPAYDDTLVEGKASGKVRSGLEPVRVRKATDKEVPAIPTADEFLNDIFTAEFVAENHPSDVGPS